MSAILTPEAVDSIAEAIFAKPEVRVVEAYSDFDVEPREFSSAQEVASYARDCAQRPGGLVYLFVHYADMGGRLVREKIRLNQGAVQGHKVRYTWNGWGLICVQLYLSDAQNRSRIVANSQARASKWAATIPENDSPDTWIWPAVQRHVRRLQRVLKRVA